MRILVTGASGFLGQAVLRELSRGHHQITVLALPGTEQMVRRSGPLSIISGSLDDIAALDRATRAMDTVIHMAGLLPDNRPREVSRVNENGTDHLVRSCARNRVRRVLFTSSTSVYAESSLPFARHISESSRVRQRATNRVEFYGLTKARAEDAILEAHERSQLEYTILRSPVVYGSNQGWDRRVFEGLQGLSWTALSHASALRNLQWLHAEDFARAVNATLANVHAANQVFNIAGKETFSMRDIALTFRTIEHGLGGTGVSKVAPGDLRYAIDKARTRLGFLPAIDLREGCRRQLALH